MPACNQGRAFQDAFRRRRATERVMQQKKTQCRSYICAYFWRIMSHEAESDAEMLFFCPRLVFHIHNGFHVKALPLAVFLRISFQLMIARLHSLPHRATMFITLSIFSILIFHDFSSLTRRPSTQNLSFIEILTCLLDQENEAHHSRRGNTPGDQIRSLLSFTHHRLLYNPVSRVRENARCRNSLSCLLCFLCCTENPDFSG